MTLELQAPPVATISAANARLVAPRNESLRALKIQIERGLEIKRSKIRYVSELERAREAKGEWTTAVMSLLKSMFNTDAVADDCQNWHGKVLPEYADLNLFIEHFYDEMDQRLRKLHAVWKRVHEVPDESPKPVAAAPMPSNPDFFDAPPAPAAMPQPSSDPPPPPQPPSFQPPMVNGNRSSPGISSAAAAAASAHSGLQSSAFVDGSSGGSGGLRSRAPSGAHAGSGPPAAIAAIVDHRWRFQDDAQLPKPRQFTGAAKKYRAGRVSTVPLNMSLLG